MKRLLMISILSAVVTTSFTKKFQFRYITPKITVHFPEDTNMMHNLTSIDTTVESICEALDMKSYPQAFSLGHSKTIGLACIKEGTVDASSSSEALIKANKKCLISDNMEIKAID